MLSAHVFRMGHAAPSQHRVTNISETGVCLSQGDMMAPGSVVVLSIGQHVNVAADVKWVRGTQAGLAFHAPIDLATARLRRTGSGMIPPVASGWLSELNHMHRD